MADGNLFHDAEAPDFGERFDELLRRPGVVVERIVSADRAPPRRFCQPADEWVVLLTGRASLTVAGRPVALVAGDHLFIAANTPHEVVSTSSGAVWLAVHLPTPGAE